MFERFGVGPVFRYEWLTTSRRWQVYAARSLFVAALLIALGAVWRSEVAYRHFETFRDLAEVGASFYKAIVGTELSLVLMVAPAAMAGAICLEKSRGTLAHVLVTDLTDAEIVLGKLAARLVPVLGFLGCVLPVLALGSLLGGIDPLDLSGAFVVLAGLAVLGSSLALVLSVWASQPFEVLLATYSIWAVWLLAPWAARYLLGLGSPAWLAAIDPLELAFTRQALTAGAGIGSHLRFLAICLGVSAALAILAVWKVRAVAIRQADGKRPASRTAEKPRRIESRVRWWPSPSLEGNPVLWREWHRNRPSRWVRVLVACFALVATLSTGWVIYGNVFLKASPFLEPWVNGLQTAIGFLLLAVVVSTSLSEERARGSLDVLLTTPLSTHEILWGKWWGAYRRVPRLTVLPGLLAYVLAWRQPSCWAAFYLLLGLILAYGAALTSLGLALGTWIRRPGRVLVVAVGIHLLITVGWAVFIMTVLSLSDGSRGIAEASPFFGPGMLTALMAEGNPPDRYEDACFTWAAIWIVVYAVIALVLYLALLASFDRSFGRVGRLPGGGRRGSNRLETRVDSGRVADPARCEPGA